MAAVSTSAVPRLRAPIWKAILGNAVRGALASLLFVASTMVATGLVQGTGSATPPDPAKALLGLFGTGIMYTIALSYPVLRSGRTGWKLVVALFIAYAGISPVLLQLESLLFLVVLVPVIPMPTLQTIMLQGFVAALLFTPLVVLAFGKIRGRSAQGQPADKTRWPLSEWTWKLVLIGVIYNAIYWSFGLFVAVPLAGPAFDQYYRDLQVPAWMPLIQLARGAFWALIMVPVMRIVAGRWWDAGLSIALLSSFLTAAPLLVPNEFMPDAMRFAHFFELLSSNFLFGWAIFWLFHRHHDSPRELFGRVGGFDD